MKIEPTDLESFKQLWHEQFDQEINTEEALAKSSQLLEMMKLLYQPLPKPSTEQKQLTILDLNPPSS